MRSTLLHVSFFRSSDTFFCLADAFYCTSSVVLSFVRRFLSLGRCILFCDYVNFFHDSINYLSFVIDNLSLTINNYLFHAVLSSERRFKYKSSFWNLKVGVKIGSDIGRIGWEGGMFGCFLWYLEGRDRGICCFLLLFLSIVLWNNLVYIAY